MRKSWIIGEVVVVLFAAVVLLPLLAFAGGTEADTVITGDGSGTWTGGSTSSNSVGTTVLNAYGIDLTSPSNDTGDAGTEVVYNFTVQNIGNCTDTLQITISGNSWPATLSASSAVLGNDVSTGITVTVGIPGGTSDGATDSFTLEVKDQDGAATEDDWPTTGNDTVTAFITTTCNAPSMTLAMVVDKATAKPYEEVTYTMDYTNDGGANASSVVLVQAIPANTKYVRDSASVSAIHAGACTIEYFTGSWSTTQPAADGDGCCPSVTQIRFTFDAAVAPAETGTITYKVRIE
jgi:uncharacterized repeat protein (TIGR01451 family)